MDCVSIISGSWTPTGTPPGPPPGPLLVSRKPGGIANELHWLVCSVMLMGLLTGLSIEPVCQVPEDKKLPSDLPHTCWSSAMVLCLPMVHHFLVEDLPCGTQVLFLHWQPIISWDHSCRSTGRTSLTHSAVWRRTWTYWHRSIHLLRFRSLKISSKTFSTVQCRSFTDHSNLS